MIFFNFCCRIGINLKGCIILESYDKFLRYEHCGVAYRGRCDDISKIVRVFLEHMPKQNEKLNRQLINEYSIYKYISKIEVKDDKCAIKFDEGEIKFGIVPSHIKSRFGSYFFDKKNNSYCFSSQCHDVTMQYLKSHHTDNICAVTSLCISKDSYLYYHSYIWDKDSDLIIDFCRNVIMRKEDYDFLFCYKEINIFNFKEFKAFISEYGRNRTDYFDLLYCAFVTLSHDDSQDIFSGDERVLRKSSIYFNY